MIILGATRRDALAGRAPALIGALIDTTRICRLVGAAAARPSFARPQQAKIPRIGVIWIGTPEHESIVLGGLRKALAVSDMFSAVILCSMNATPRGRKNGYRR